MKNIGYIICLVLYGVCSFLYASEKEKNQLQADIEKMQFFSANFTQKVVDKNHQVLQNIEGKMAIKKPGYFYWKQFDEDNLLIVADGKSVYIFDELIEQVTILKSDDAINETPLALLVSQDKTIWQDYHVNFVDQCYQLKHQKVGLIKTMSVCFEKHILQSLSFVDDQNTHTIIEFTQPSRKENMSLFAFSIPKGVSVDDRRQ